MNKHFHYRTVAVLVTETHVLLHKAEIDDFWSMPGGHVEWGETARQALVREYREETGLKISPGRLLWVVENFFTYNQDLHHEIGLYFLVDLPENSPILNMDNFSGIEIPDHREGKPIRLVFQWHPRQRQVLEKLPVYPIFLQQGLVRLPEHCTHILNQEIDNF